MLHRFALSALAVPAAAAVLTACASSGHSGHNASGASTSSTTASTSSVSSSIQAGPPASGPHNDADRTFASDMIPHHRQAVEMATMAVSTSTNARVLALAKVIKTAQDPEIATMTGWLEGWNAPVPSGSMSHGASHAGMSMPGMMSDADMAALAKATGPAFDKMWLTMMVAHHEGAVSMSKTELAGGQNSQVKALANSIISSQTGEIRQMTALLATL